MTIHTWKVADQNGNNAAPYAIFQRSTMAMGDGRCRWRPSILMLTSTDRQLRHLIMNTVMKMMIAAAAFTLAAGAQAGEVPDFTNWTTESLHEIFIPTAHITYAHGKIKTVTFPFKPKDEDGYPTKILHWTVLT